MKMPSVMSHNFSQVPKADIPRSSFNRSHGYKTTFDAGYLVPILVDEALPGDTFNCKMTAFARLATPVVPVMDNLYCDTFFFAVPMRLVWDKWEQFNGQQQNPDSTTDYIIPQMVSTASTGYAINSIHDYFGLPTGIPGYTHSCLFHRAYNLIWNEWFRDQNLQNSLDVPMDDGPDLPSEYSLQKRGKRHDYFTSALPWPQKGPAVSIPLGTSANVYGVAVTSSNDTMNIWQAWNASGRMTSGVDVTGNATSTNRTLIGGSLADSDGSARFSLGTPEDYDTEGTPPYADLSSATAATINSLRAAFQLQKLFERDARGGTRYTEIIRAHFGVVSPDARLQRPEYLGGGSSPINIAPIAQTSESGSTPQGNLAAMGTMTASGHGFTKSFTEHCIIIGLASVRADLNYQQGLNRMWSRRTRFEFYWPALSHLGEQAVLNKEIYCQSDSVTDSGGVVNNQAFGYQEAFAEYRYKPSQITGQFRSTASTSLDVWHLAQEFSSLPELDSTFIQENPPMDRIIAVDEEPDMLFDAYFDLKCARPMPVYSVPGLIDHF